MPTHGPFDASTADNTGDQRISRRQPTTTAMEPIAGYSRGQPSGWRDSAAKTGTTQFGRHPPRTKTPGWSGTRRRRSRLWVGNQVKGDVSHWNRASGAAIYGSGLPSDIWKATMDGALKGTSNETFSNRLSRWLCRCRRRRRYHLRRPSSSPRSKSRRDYYPDRSPDHHYPAPPPRPCPLRDSTPP